MEMESHSEPVRELTFQFCIMYQIDVTKTQLTKPQSPTKSSKYWTRQITSHDQVSYNHSETKKVNCQHTSLKLVTFVAPDIKLMAYGGFHKHVQAMFDD